MIPEISGIYKIINLINNKIYIGSATNLQQRKNNHWYRKKGNPHLKNAMNKYGRNNFKFEVLEYVEDKTKLLEREQYYLNLLNPDYNIAKIAGNRLGVKHSEETKRKISEIQIGKKLSEKEINNLRKIMKNNKRAKQRKIICINNNQIYSSMTEAGKILNISLSGIAMVVNNKRNSVYGLIFKEV